MQKTTKRKGLTVWGLTNAAFVIVLLGVSLGIGTWINAELMSSAYGTTTVTNETVTFAVNDTYYDLVYRAKSITSIQNMTYGAYDSDDWTVRDMGFGSQVKLTVLDELSFTTNQNVTYESLQSDSHFITMNSTSALSSLASWIPIIAIIIAAGVVIGTLMVWFSRR